MLGGKSKVTQCEVWIKDARNLFILKFQFQKFEVQLPRKVNIL